MGWAGVILLNGDSSQGVVLDHVCVVHFSRARTENTELLKLS